MKILFTIILTVLIGISVFTPNTSIHTAPETTVDTVMDFDFEEEQYIDDIPFNTELIAKQAI